MQWLKARDGMDLMTRTPEAGAFDFGIAVEDGVVLRCTSVGEGPAVVLLHAGGERRLVWKPVAARLCASGFRAISVDLRGHGDTGGDPGTNLDVHGRDLATLIDSLAVPVTLVGASLGGFVSLLVTRYPDTASRVERVVLVDVVPDPDPHQSRSYLRAVESSSTAGGKRGWEWRLVEDIFQRAAQLRSAAAELAVPLALVRGAAGRVGPTELQRFARIAPSAMVKNVDGAGHLVARDRPHELADVLIEILVARDGECIRPARPT